MDSVHCLLHSGNLLSTSLCSSFSVPSPPQMQNGSEKETAGAYISMAKVSVGWQCWFPVPLETGHQDSWVRHPAALQNGSLILDKSLRDPFFPPSTGSLTT